MNAAITIALDDGSGCYAVRVPVDDFSVRTVARAANDAAATLISSFALDRAVGGTWDPALWKARNDSLLRSR